MSGEARRPTIQPRFKETPSPIGFDNNFTVADEVAKEDGQGMAATLFVKGGDEYIRVATNVPKPDGSGQAIGTVLAGPPLESIKMGKLGTPYVTDYEPIKDASGAIVGVYLVGYSQSEAEVRYSRWQRPGRIKVVRVIKSDFHWLSAIRIRRRHPYFLGGGADATGGNCHIVNLREELDSVRNSS